jgi:hypothetical protein
LRIKFVYVGETSCNKSSENHPDTEESFTYPDQPGVQCFRLRVTKGR